MRITFDEVNLYGEKTVKCAVCGKRIKRRRKFYQTLNPWNKGPDGLPKTRDDILTDLRQGRDAWLQAPETCQTCQQHGGEGR